MVLKHVSQYPGMIIVSSPMLHTEGLRSGYIDMIDVRAVPEWFENRIAKSKYQDILNRLFRQIMIDAVDLAFLEAFVEPPIELNSRAQIPTKGIFDHDP